jgi:5-methylcytosine-specific restriction endonuclease McrA
MWWQEVMLKECAWCGAPFATTKDGQLNCSKRCKRKAIMARRRGRQYGSTCHFTWAEFMRLFVGEFDRCCAYCAQPIEGQPDPDHVVPLSRGGSNSITNILPSCRPCNSDKRDLLLGEWAIDRRRRGLPTRVTDPVRWHHLTDALLAA